MNRVAVIGLGNISSRHRRNLRTMFPDTKIYALSASGRVGVGTVEDCDQLVSTIEELISERIELAIVASPATLHKMHAIPLIEAGIPTLIEKPVVTNIADADAILSAVKQHNTPVAVGYCLRYLSSAIKLKSYLDAGKVGKLYNANVEIGQFLPDWRPGKNYIKSVSANRDLGGGALFELSHEIDYTLWLLGPLKLKYAKLRTTQELNLDVEDIADIIALSFHDVVTNIHLDFLQRKAHRKCSFVGSDGRIDWDLNVNRLSFTDSGGTIILYEDSEWDKNKMYIAMIDDFLNLIKGRDNNCVTIVEAKLVVQLIEKIKEGTYD